MKYTNLIVDVLNFAYRFVESLQYNKQKVIQSKNIYVKVFTSFVEKLREIESKYLDLNGSVYLLFDNSDSRMNLADSFYNIKRKSVYPEYKSHRKKDNIEFYNTIDFIKYYYMISEPRYKCIQIPNIEADDLVKPLLKKLKPSEFNLFITNDSDWARYLSDKNHMLSDLSSEPMSQDEYSNKVGYPISEMNIILFKSIFGDNADSIPSLLKQSKLHLAQFNELIMNKTFEDTTSIFLEAKRMSFEIFKNKEFQDNLRQFQINLQLTSPIDIDGSHLDAATVIGRNAFKLKEAIEKKTGLLVVSKKFTFGFNRPRV